MYEDYLFPQYAVRMLIERFFYRYLIKASGGIGLDGLSLQT